MFRTLSVAACGAISFILAEPTYAFVQEREGYSIASRDFGWWSGEFQIRVGNNDEGRRAINGLSCTLRGTDGISITLTRPVESSRLLVDFAFAIEGDDTQDRALTERQVISLGVGGRTYEFDRIQWRFSPEFLGWEPSASEIQLSFGRTMAAVRSGERYPWLPVEYLIPAMMEVETLRLGYRGKSEIAHGEYEIVYRERDIRMDGFSEGMAWCGTALRSERSIELPPELRRPQ